MAEHRWSRIAAVITLSVLASTVVSAGTSQWPSPLRTPAVAGERSSAPRRPEVSSQSVAIRDRHPSEVVRLPPVGSAAISVLPGATSARNSAADVSRRGNVLRRGDTDADGTWSEDGRYLVIHLNGQQLRLVRTDSLAAPDSGLPEKLGGGNVNGRLSHRGRPLVECEVALVPLKKSWSGYTLNNSGELLATTDDNGKYYLRNVPAGPYKLKWRPAGESSWIRRAEVRPDVRVRKGETSQVKEIRVALRTIN